MQPKNIIKSFLKAVLIVVVYAFTGLLSYSFWQWTFPPAQWYYALLGFGLTGGAVPVYLAELKWGQEDSDLQKTIALIMLIVSVLGEVATAGFGIHLEILTRAAVVPTPDDFKFMTMSVQVLILLHFAALVASFSGDKIIEMFEEHTGRDINRDGVIGKKNKRSDNKPQHPPTNHTVDDYLAKIGKTYPEAQAQWRGKTYGEFAKDTNTKFDHIDGQNMRAIFGELVGSENPRGAERGNSNHP